MRTIWKYQLDPAKEVVIHGGARLIVRHVGVDPSGSPEIPSVWVELDTEDLPEPEEMALVFIGTGQPLPDGVYVGSCIASGGFVWHVFATERNVDYDE